VEQRPWVRDFAPVVAAFGLCPLVALAGGDDRGAALARARDLVDAEQALGAFVEPAIHAWGASRPWLMTVAGAAYLFLHVPVLIGALAWVYLLHPDAFARLRTTFLAAQTLTVVGWLLLPTAPPRMLGGLGFEDTLAELWGASAEEGASWLQSPLAAMPNGHVVFALIAGGAIVLLARPPAVRAVGAFYPLAVVAMTVVTANHFWLDALGAVVVVLVAVATAVAAPAVAPALRLRVLSRNPG